MSVEALRGSSLRNKPVAFDISCLYPDKRYFLNKLLIEMCLAYLFAGVGDVGQINVNRRLFSRHEVFVVLVLNLEGTIKRYLNLLAIADIPPTLQSLIWHWNRKVRPCSK